MMRAILTSVLLCGLLSPSASGEGDGMVLQGAGATFPHPLYRKWIEEYRRETRVRITYEAVGSGAGIRFLLERSVDFGATDAYLSDTELETAEAPILHIPTCLGAVVAIYRLPGDPDLRFSPRVLADLFSGKIERWNDPRLRADNPEADLPDLKVRLIHRSDASGTTFLFTDYLSQVSSAWRTNIGRGKSVRWPKGIGVEGNPKVAEFVKRIPGAVGYVSLSYARANHLPVAAVRNRSGHFVQPTLRSVSDAAHVRLPHDARMLITNTTAEAGYPISAFTYLIVYEEQNYARRSPARAQALRDFLHWAVTKGQEYCENLNYARLPDQAASLGARIVGRMRCNGKPIPAQKDTP